MMIGTIAIRYSICEDAIICIMLREKERGPVGGPEGCLPYNLRLFGA